MMEKPEGSSALLGNRYQVQRSLGAGGMSIVYLARDLMLERPVAIKLLRQDFSKDSGFRDRFRQEAKDAANLSHPNIVTVHDFGFDSGRLFIVMEYIPGTDLKTIIRQSGQMKAGEAIPLMIQACAGIGYAHRAGLVHCDVKPHNMLVTPDQRLKVTDFGIARVLSTIHPDEKSDVVWGSPQYFSPEQARGRAPSPASDVYCLGIIMYEMLAGRLPFISNDPIELSRMHKETLPPPLHQLNQSISPELEQIINKVLSKEPSSRYRSADQLGRILTSFIQSAGSYDSVIPQIPAQTGQTPVSNPTIQALSPETTTPQPSIPTSPPQVQTISGLHKSVPPSLDQSKDAAQHKETTNFDWITIGLGLLTAISLSGLIPFWIYVWFKMNSVPPIP